MGSTQLRHTAALDVRSFEAALRLQGRGNGRKIHREEGKKGQRCIEKAQLSSRGETHTATQSLALQMLAIGSVNGVQAFRAEFEYCLSAAW